MNLDILFDASYLAHRCKSVFVQQKEKEYGREVSLTEIFNEKENQAQFFRKMIIEFCYTVRELQFCNINRVMFAFDNPNWRVKKYPFYKNKTKTEYEKVIDEENSLGKTVFYEIISKFEKHVNKMGFSTSRAFNYEADDLCYLYAVQYELDEKNLIIISGDKDGHQYISKYVSIYRNNSVAPAYYHFGDAKSLFIAENLLKKNKKLKHEIIDPNKHIFTKIIVGDDGDNVPSLIKGVGIKTAEKLYQKSFEFGLNDCRFFDESYVEKYCDFLHKNIKNSELLTITQCVKRNIELMYLDFSVYDENESMSTFEKIQIDKFGFKYCGEYNIGNVLGDENSRIHNKG